MLNLKLHFRCSCQNTWWSIWIFQISMDNIFSVYVWNLSYYTSVNRKKLLDVTTDFFFSLLNPNFLVCCEVQEKTEKILSLRHKVLVNCHFRQFLKLVTIAKKNHTYWQLSRYFLVKYILPILNSDFPFLYCNCHTVKNFTLFIRCHNAFFFTVLNGIWTLSIWCYYYYFNKRMVF